MDAQLKGSINTEEKASSYMKLVVTTESKNRLKYYLDLLGYHHIAYKVEKIKLIGDTFSEVCVLPHHYKVARNMWRQTIEAVLDETEIFTD